MKKIFKIILYFIITIFLIILISYIALNIFIKTKEIKVDKNILLQETTVSLTDRQMEIASYMFNEQKNPKFHNYFFLINDTFSFRNQVALITASTYIAEFDYIHRVETIERHIIELATKRYIMKNIDYRICYNYLFSKLYFGNEKYGLLDASEFYYDKPPEDLSDKEFISLCLIISKSPVRYDLVDENGKKANLEETYRIFRELSE